MVTTKVALPKSSKKRDISELSWDELRAFAKSHGVLAKGTRAKLEAKVTKQLDTQGQAILKTKVPSKTATKSAATKKAVTKKAAIKKAAIKKAATGMRGFSADTSFKVGQRVQVIATEERGEVSSVSSKINVDLTAGITKAFFAGELKKLQPIL